MYQFAIDVNYYADTGVYVGTSDDIPGLTLETETIAELLEVAMDIVPHLLSNNLNIPKGSQVKINVVLPPEQSEGSDGLHPTYTLGQASQMTELVT
ncbi:MAG: DUF1902 domain-containing protein [Gammaproteobacteria bacterium]|nr:DUF1902 domain-containing protein [Gammaproteobacteria bacterium]MDE0479997.1 DUF1902 domain-containing protein [Gammaproteobacteria bacterium]MDE0509263.1 DUF1902 domain-containing protein [Gammaproteobacteria bacterium]MYA36223.1 DUF1902 domain-containing protein [Gammaproteobacteria bacterium]MYA66826.1 DUF1902 domain-containing protein [Gammaproteobacteria bacterium]